jgi:hypothetical protein
VLGQGDSQGDGSRAGEPHRCEGDSRIPSTVERRVVFSRRGGQSSMAAPVHSRRHKSVTVWVSGKRMWLDEWRWE